MIWRHREITIANSITSFLPTFTAPPVAEATLFKSDEESGKNGSTLNRVASN